MKHIFTPQPIKTVKFITPGVLVVMLVALNGLVFLAGRFLFGIGSVTNLNNFYPWGLWIGVDVAAGVALAAGGFFYFAKGNSFYLERLYFFVCAALFY